MTHKKPIRVLIVDDHAMIRSGLATFLEVYDDLEFVGEAASGEEAIRLCSDIRPDVVLMDLMMSGVDGIEATRAIRERCPETQVVALTTFRDQALVQRAMQAGAIGYLLKNIAADELAAAIRAGAAGRPTLSDEATLALINAAVQSTSEPVDLLTERELDVLALLVQGLNNAEIADRLTIGRSTVKTHVSNILSKLGVGNRSEAAVAAVKLRLVR